MFTGTPSPRSDMHSFKLICAMEGSLKACAITEAAASPCRRTPGSSDGIH